MKKLLILLIAFVLFGCDEMGDKRVKTRRGIEYTPIKVCAIGSVDDTGCFTYQADTYDIGSNTLHIRTIDGHYYVFNVAGWAYIITKE